MTQREIHMKWFDAQLKCEELKRKLTLLKPNSCAAYIAAEALRRETEKLETYRRKAINQ